MSRVVGHALAGEQVPVFGDGENVRDWLYARVTLGGCWRLLKGKCLALLTTSEGFLRGQTCRSLGLS